MNVENRINNSISQILSIDLASEMPPAISLAYEQPEKDIMKRPPRSRKSKVGDWSLISLRSLIFDLAAALQITSLLLIHCDGNDDDLWMLPSLHECILVSELIFELTALIFELSRCRYHGIVLTDIVFTAEQYWKVRSVNDIFCGIWNRKKTSTNCKLPAGRRWEFHHRQWEYHSFRDGSIEDQRRSRSCMADHSRVGAGSTNTLIDCCKID